MAEDMTLVERLREVAADEFYAFEDARLMREVAAFIEIQAAEIATLTSQREALAGVLQKIRDIVVKCALSGFAAKEALKELYHFSGDISSALSTLTEEARDAD